MKTKALMLLLVATLLSTTISCQKDVEPVVEEEITENKGVDDRDIIDRYVAEKGMYGYKFEGFDYDTVLVAAMPQYLYKPLEIPKEGLEQVFKTDIKTDFIMVYDEGFEELRYEALWSWYVISFAFVDDYESYDAFWESIDETYSFEASKWIRYVRNPYRLFNFDPKEVTNELVENVRKFNAEHIETEIITYDKDGVSYDAIKVKIGPNTTGKKRSVSMSIRTRNFLTDYSLCFIQPSM